MCKSKILSDVMEIVAAETGIAAEDMRMNGKVPEVVDARCLLFHTLFTLGFIPTEIARMMGKSRQSVTTLLNSFDDRVKFRGKMLSIFLHNIRKKVADISLKWEEA